MKKSNLLEFYLILIVDEIDVLDKITLFIISYNYIAASYTIATYIIIYTNIYTNLIIILRIASLFITDKNYKNLSIDNLNRIDVISVDKESYRRI